MDGIPTFSSDQHGVCKGCYLGMYAKTIFPRSDSRSKGILEIIHFDVCGQMMVPSLGKFVNYVLFIDENS